MKNRMAIKIVLAVLAAVILFHLLIMIRIIPYEVTWGGRLSNDTEMYVFETISIVVNLFLGFILLIKGGYIKPYVKRRVVNMILWVFLCLFILNTIGNVFSKTTFERSFAVLTLLLAFLIWIILRRSEIRSEKDSSSHI
jgi:hypothetical protein